MPLYEGLKGGQGGQGAPPAARRVLPSAPAREARPSGPRAGAWREVRASVAPTVGDRAGRGWLDALLGRGSSEKLRSALGPGRAPERPARPARPGRTVRPVPRLEERPARPARVSVVGGGGEVLESPRGRRGVGRALLVVLVLGVACGMLRPWRRRGGLRPDWEALLRLPGPARDPAEARAAARAREARDAAALAGLPLRPATGTPLALWRAPDGSWWRVDASGGLAPCGDPDGAGNLGLPRLAGVAAHAEPLDGGRREALDLPAGLLGRLLPLRTTLGSEVAAIDLSDPDSPVLVTLDGTRCLLGAGDWRRAQGRLALVLADLAARGRRASQVDLRFEGTAVVRPL